MLRSTLALTAVLALAGPVTPALAQSDGNPATSTMLTGGLIVPYDGYLVLDATPVNGTATLRFELWDDPVATAATRRVWSEEQTVEVAQGRFSVGLGAGTRLSARAIEDVVRDGERVYLAILVRDTGGQFIALSGRQQLEAVPYAAWSASAADLGIGGDLTVGGQISVGAGANQVTVGGGAVTTPRVASAGPLTAGRVAVGGAIQAGSFSTPGAAQFGSVATAGQVQAASVQTAGQLQAGSLRVTNGAVNAQQIAGQAPIRTAGEFHVGGDNLVMGTNADARGNGGRALVAETGDTLVVNRQGEFTGGTLVESNLTYTGTFSGWTRSGALQRDSNGTSTVFSATNSVCFLTKFSTDHDGRDPGRMRCELGIQNGNWVLVNQEQGGSRGDVNCTAYCVQF